jgi:hypothetical protein
MSTATKDKKPTVAHDVADPIKHAIESGMGAIETTALAAAEIPLSVLKSLGVSEEAMVAAREGHAQMVRGIHSALSTIATGITDTSTGIASGVTQSFAAAATATAEVAEKAGQGSKKS